MFLDQTQLWLLNMIDVIIPTNTADGLSRSLQSCSLHSIENVWIISNNCSQEMVESIESIARQFTNATHKHLGAGGVNQSRNVGLNLSHNVWVIFLDCGDLLLPIRGNEPFGGFTSDVGHPDVLIYDYKERSTNSVESIHKSLSNGNFDANALLENHIQTQSCTINRNFLRQAGISWDEGLQSSQDFDFYLQCTQAKPSFHHVQQPGSVRVVSETGISANWQKVSNTQEVVLCKHKSFIRSSALTSRAALRIFSVFHLNGRGKISSLLVFLQKFGLRHCLYALYGGLVAKRN